MADLADEATSGTSQSQNGMTSMMALLDAYSDKETKLKALKALDIEAKIEISRQLVDVLPHSSKVEVNVTMILAAAETPKGGGFTLFKSVPASKLLRVVFAFSEHYTVKRLLRAITKEMRIYLL